jgi:hypothetical protein
MPLAEVFPNTSKPIIGMLHLPPLPGSYNYNGQPLDDIVEHALREAEILAASGFDGFLMQNAGDRPASLEVCPEKVAYMSVIGAAVHRAHPIQPLGVNVCWNVPKATIAVCHAAGGAFIRLEHVYIGMAITAHGPVYGCAYEATQFLKLLDARCSPANTLRIQGLEFGREKLTKGPHMFSQARRHRRCPLAPSQTNCSLALACLHWQLGAQTHVWPGDIVERLKEDHPTAHLHTVLAEAGGFADQRGQRLAQGQVQAFDQRRADPETALREAFGSEQDAGADGHELALLLLFNQLPVDQLRVGRDDGLARATPRARSWKRRHGVEAGNQRRQITREGIAEEGGDPTHARLGRGDHLLGRLERARPDNGRNQEAKLRGETHPDPLPALGTVGKRLAALIRLTGVFTCNEIPHLVELHLCDGKLAKQVCVDLLCLEGRPAQPLQDRFLRHAEHERDACKIDPDQEHLQGHDHLLFGGAQVEEDGVAGFRESRVAVPTAEDATLSTGRQVGGDGTDVASVHKLEAGALGIGARLVPVFGASHEPVLRSGLFAKNPIVGLASLHFQSTSG